MQGRYDPRVSLGVNTSLSGPLLSRFDIVLVLQDLKNPDWDETVANHILFGTTNPSSSFEEAVRSFTNFPACLDGRIFKPVSE